MKASFVQSGAPQSSATPELLAEQLRWLGVREGGVLVVHTSFRAVRPVVGGPRGLISALCAAVGQKGTVVMPSWSDNDAIDFDRASTPAAADLGVTADIFWRLPGALRSNHVFACAAIGPHATEILRDPLPLPPHRPESPIGRTFQLNAQVLLLGVGHDANTTIHLAEVLANVPYGIARQCTTMRNGRSVRVEYVDNDHCCQRFALADDWMRTSALQREGRIGRAHARLMDSRALVRCVRARLEDDPTIFLHGPEAGCVECDEARNWSHDPSRLFS